MRRISYITKSLILPDILERFRGINIIIQLHVKSRLVTLKLNLMGDTLHTFEVKYYSQEIISIINKNDT